MKAWRTLSSVLVLFILVAGGGYYISEELDTEDDGTFRVVNIVDGDTITVVQEDMKHSVRLIGIDAPERGQCFYEESGFFLADIILGQEVTLAPDPINNDTDEYGRLLRYVYLDGNLVNERMVEAGMAEHFDVFPFSFDRQFANLERDARRDDLGLWDEC